MLENRNGQEIAVPASDIKIMHIYAIQLLAVIETWNIKTHFWKKKWKILHKISISQKAFYIGKYFWMKLLTYVLKCF